MNKWTNSLLPTRFIQNIKTNFENPQAVCTEYMKRMHTLRNFDFTNSQNSEVQTSYPCYSFLKIIDNIALHLI